MINKAIMFASACHANQTRKGTEIPYILHPLETGTIAARLCTKDSKIDQEIICAAILHDVMEDAFISYETLVEMFGKKVADLVQIQSEDKSKPWAERKQITINQLNNNTSISFEIVILADKLSNLRAIHRDYKVLGCKLWERFNVKEQYKHEWYYKSIKDNINQLVHTQEFQEYMKLFDEVFVK